MIKLSLLLLISSFAHAEIVHTKKIKVDKKTHEKYESKADMLYGRNSLTHFQAELKKHPDNIELKSNYARALLLAGKNKESLKVYNELLKTADIKNEWLKNRGICLLRLKKWDKARTSLSTAYQNQKRKDPYLTLSIVKVHYIKGELKEARKFLNELSSNRNYVSYLIELGDFLYDSHSYKDALNIFEEGLIQNAKSPILNFKIAETAIKLQRKGLAKSSFKTFLNKTSESEKWNEKRTKAKAYLAR